MLLILSMCSIYVVDDVDHAFFSFDFLLISVFFLVLFLCICFIFDFLSKHSTIIVVILSYSHTSHRKLILVFISKSAIVIIATGVVVVALHLPWHWFCVRLCFVIIRSNGVWKVFFVRRRLFLFLAFVLYSSHRLARGNQQFFFSSLMSFVYKKKCLQFEIPIQYKYRTFLPCIWLWYPCKYTDKSVYSLIFCSLYLSCIHVLFFSLYLHRSDIDGRMRALMSM